MTVIHSTIPFLSSVQCLERKDNSHFGQKPIYRQGILFIETNKELEQISNGNDHQPFKLAVTP